MTLEERKKELQALVNEMNKNANELNAKLFRAIGAIEEIDRQLAEAKK